MSVCSSAVTDGQRTKCDGDDRGVAVDRHIDDLDVVELAVAIEETVANGALEVVGRKRGPGPRVEAMPRVGVAAEVEIVVVGDDDVCRAVSRRTDGDGPDHGRDHRCAERHVSEPSPSVRAERTIRPSGPEITDEVREIGPAGAFAAGLETAATMPSRRCAGHVLRKRPRVECARSNRSAPDPTGADPGEGEAGRSEGGEGQNAPGQALPAGDLTGGEQIRERRDVGLLPHDHAVGEAVETLPTGSPQQRVVELVVREDELEVVAAGMAEELLERADARGRPGTWRPRAARPTGW